MGCFRLKIYVEGEESVRFLSWIGVLLDLGCGFVFSFELWVVLAGTEVDERRKRG